MNNNKSIRIAVILAVGILLIVFVQNEKHKAAQVQDYCLKGAQCLCGGFYFESLNCYKKALAISPNNVDANIGLALLCETLGKYKDAQKFYIKAFKK